MVVRQALKLSRFTSTFLYGLLIGGLVGMYGVTLSKAYPTEPEDWRCEKTANIPQEYRLCRIPMEQVTFN